MNENRGANTPEPKLVQVKDEHFKHVLDKYVKLFGKDNPVYMKLVSSAFLLLKGYPPTEDGKKLKEWLDQEIDSISFAREWLNAGMMSDIALFNLAKGLIERKLGNFSGVKTALDKYVQAVQVYERLEKLTGIKLVLGVDVGLDEVNTQELERILAVAESLRGKETEKVAWKGYDQFTVTDSILDATKRDLSASLADDDILLWHLLSGFTMMRGKEHVDVTQYYLVDISSSMNYENGGIKPLEVAKGIVLGLGTTAVNSGKRVLIYTFAGTLGPTYSITRKEDLKQFLMLRGDGYTDVNQPLLQFVERVRNMPGQKEIVVLTDGLFILDPALAGKIRAMHVSVSFVIIKEKIVMTEIKELMRLSKETGGKVVIWQKGHFTSLRI